MSDSDHSGRKAPVNLSGDEFRRAGHALVDQLADFYAGLPAQAVTPGESPREVRDALGRGPLPDTGMSAEALLAEIAPQMFAHSLHNGHPRFMGYITSSASPLGALADLLASAVNPNLGRWDVAPFATEIEAQTVRWLAELVGYPTDAAGLMVSGGNMANFLGFIAARRAQASWQVRSEGLYGEPRKLAAYVSAEAHTWVEKAADVSGLGTDAVRWVAVDGDQRMRMDDLQALLRSDRRAGLLPFLLVGTAGTTGTGAIDPLPEMARLARAENLWFHVDGAYGAPVAALPDAPSELGALAEADSLALDPHKWLYSPLEAACVLTRSPTALEDAFSFLPSYYKLDKREEAGKPGINYYNSGMQNSRGFRALKVWLGLRQVGRTGVVDMISDDMRLARRLHACVAEEPELEARTQALSITTFRYLPTDLAPQAREHQDYLNRLNQELLDDLQRSGEAFVSNAIVSGDYLLRACIVNFRTHEADVDAIPGIVVRFGRSVDQRLRKRLGLSPQQSAQAG